MSALAKLCFSRGIFVSGSDRVQTDLTDELEHIGIEIHIGHSKKNLQNPDLVVYTCAVDKNNVELSYARKLGIKILERADFLGEITKGFKTVIAVAGSHGKTTVSAMIGSVFYYCGKSPTMIVGGEINGIGNLLIGKNDFLIVEACEYQEHFLKIKPTVAAILNIDYDHPDFFKSQNDYINAFVKFSHSANQAVINEKFKMLTNGNVLTFGKFGNFESKHVEIKNGKIDFIVFKNGKRFAHIVLNSYANYNVENALCAVAVCDICGISSGQIEYGLSKFEGVKRRYEYMGKLSDNIVITDYAHHPTQIADCILATKRAYKRPVVAIFEPHTYSRTKTLFADFVNALCLADSVIMLPTYSAREKHISGASGKDLYNAIKFRKTKVFYKPSYKSCKSILATFKNSVILILGAGSVINLAKDIKNDYMKNQKK